MEQSSKRFGQQLRCCALGKTFCTTEEMRGVLQLVCKMDWVLDSYRNFTPPRFNKTTIEKFSLFVTKKGIGGKQKGMQVTF